MACHMAPAAAEVSPCPLQDLGALLQHLDRTLSTLTHSGSSLCLQARLVLCGAKQHMTASNTGPSS